MKDKLNIVNLIEKDPKIRLSLEYKSKFINKIIEQFTDHQQQLFVASFYCYLYCSSKKDFIIDLNNIWKWIGFSRKDHAKRLLEKYFIDNIDYQILLPHLGEQKNKLKDEERGGYNKEQIMMTTNTFKKLCLKANTKKADEIHDYYIKLEELLHETINEETDELRNQLQIKDEQHNKDLKINKHKILIRLLKGKKSVYVGEIEKDKYKIGSTKDVNERKTGLNNEYDNLTFCEVFECDNFREVEENILRDPIIVKHLYKKPIKSKGGSSKEVVQLSENFNYNQLIAIVKKYVNDSNTTFMTPVQILEKQKIDYEKYKMDHELLMAIINNDKYSDKVNSIIQETLPQVFQNISINVDHENEYDDKYKEKNFLENKQENIMQNVIRNRRKPQGRKIQKIDQHNLKNIIKVYDSMVYLLRSPENEGLNKVSIEKASKNNIIYKSFRWNFVEKDENPNISNIKPTVIKKNIYENSVICQLDNTQTKILDSFPTKKCLGEKLGIAQFTLKKIIDNKTKFNNNYYLKSKDCPKELLNNYHGLIKRVNYGSKRIKQINSITKDETIFNSLNEINIKLGFKSATIKNAIENNILIGGSLWEYYKDN